nr:hypothetical protein [Actinomycetota bacterium]
MVYILPMPGTGTTQRRRSSVIRSTVIPLLVLAVAAACGADEPGSGGGDAGATTVPGHAASASTVTTPVSLRHCPAGIGAAAQDPDQAARCLYAAWREDSRASAAVFASLDVVDSLFAERWSPPEGNLRPCVSDPDIGALACGVDFLLLFYFFDVR